MQNWLRLRDVPDYIFKKTGLRFKKDTVRNWVTSGKASYSGQKIVLRASKRCGFWVTTEKWIDEFIEEVNR